MICVKLGADIRVRPWVSALMWSPIPLPDWLVGLIVKYGIDIRPYTVREDSTKDYM